MNTIKMEIYKNEELTNEFNTGIDGLVNIMAAAIQGAGKAQIRHTGIDTADLTYTFSYRNHEDKVTKYKYIYKNIPCTSGRIDTQKLRG